MVAVVLFALVIAGVLALLLARYATNPAVVRAEGALASADSRPRIPAVTLRTLVIDLLTQLGYDVVEEEVTSESSRRLVASQRAVLGGSQLIAFIEPSPAGDLVGQETMIELAEQVKALRASVGLLITPYAVDTAGLAGLEGPVEVIDGPRFRALVATQLAERLADLDRYRGFGPPAPAEPPTLAPRPA